MDRGDEGEAGSTPPMKKFDPKEDEKKEHDQTHLRYRNWCRHCIGGKWKEEPCRKQDSGEGPAA